MSTFSSIIKSIDMLCPARESIYFVSQTASLTVQANKTAQGRLLKHTLTFNIANISSENDILISKMYCATSFFVHDSHNYISVIGNKTMRPKVSVDKETQGVAGGFRGYIVTVTWSSI